MKKATTHPSPNRSRLRISVDEVTALQLKADASVAGLTLSAYLRWILLN